MGRWVTLVDKDLPQPSCRHNQSHVSCLFTFLIVHVGSDKSVKCQYCFGDLKQIRKL